MKRRPLFYIIIIIIPSYIITMVSLVGLFSPRINNGDREEKVTLGLTTLLTMSVMLLGIQQQMPRSSDGMPLLGFVRFNCITLNSHR